MQPRLQKEPSHVVVRDVGMGARVVHKKHFSWLVTDVEAAVLESSMNPVDEKELIESLVPRFPRPMVIDALSSLKGNALVQVRRRRRFPRLRDHVLLPRVKVRTGNAVWETIRATAPRKILLLRPAECLEDLEPVRATLCRRFPVAEVELAALPKEGWATEMRRRVRASTPDVVCFHQGRKYSRYHPGVVWKLGRLRARHKVLFLGGQEILVDRSFAVLHPLRIFAKFITLQRFVVWTLALECRVLDLLDRITFGPLVRRRRRVGKRGRQVLLISVGGIGDVTNIAGAVALLKDAWPESEITVLSRGNTESVVRTIRGVDHTIDVTALHAGNPRRPMTYVRWLVRLFSFQRQPYDVAVMLQWYGFGIRPLVWAYTLLYLSRAGRRIAPLWRFPGALKRIRFATEYVRRDPGVDQATQAFRFTRVVLEHKSDDEPASLPERYFPKLHPRDEDRIHARELIKAHGLDRRSEFLFAIAPGTARNKIWSYERFAEVADQVVEELGARIVLLGSQRILMHAIARRMRHPSVVVSDLDAALLPAFVECMDLFLSNDSGPLHLAAALGVPAVGLFGPTDPAVWAPNFAPNVTILREGDCPPCGDQMRCTQPRRICMESITVAQVMDALRRRSARRGSERPDRAGVGQSCV